MVRLTIIINVAKVSGGLVAVIYDEVGGNAVEVHPWVILHQDVVYDGTVPVKRQRVGHRSVRLELVD